MKIKDIQDKEKQQALLARAKAINLTDEATEIEVEEAEKKIAKAKSEDVTVVEKEVRGLLQELRDRVSDKSITSEEMRGMIEEVVKKNADETKKAKEATSRLAEHNADDADPGRKFSKTGKVSGKFTFKHFITGNAPRRAVRKYAEELKDLQDMNDEILIVSKCLNKSPKELEMYGEFEEKAMEFATKALYNTAGSGAEFIPTNFSAQVVDKVRLELKVAAVFDRIPMRSNPYTVPLEGNDSTAYLAAESTVEATEAGRITVTTPTTSNVTFTAKKLAARTVFSEEISEDSIVDILDYVRKKISIALANAAETATINGDTTGTHMDADVTSSTDARKAWKGLRKHTITAAKRDAGGDALIAADLRIARKLMGVFGINASNLVWVVGVSGMHQMLSTNDANGFNDFRTLEKIGPSAQVLTGMIGAFDNIPVIVSEFVREDLNASGVQDGVTQTLTVAQLVNRTRFWYGDRKLVTLKTFEDIQTDQQVMVIKQRLDYQPVESAARALTATVYNILA